MSGPWEDYAPAPAKAPAQRQPRGIRNNNPGNIEDGSFARSIPGYKGTDGRFAVYDSPEAGNAAHATLLGSYGRKGLNTVEGVVGRWAPPSENNTGAYAKFVAQRLGVDPRAPLDMNDPKVLSSMAAAMGEHENGQPVAVSGDTPPWMDYSGSGSPKAPPMLNAGPGAPQATTAGMRALAGPAPPDPSTLKADQGLGFLKGVTAPVFNVSGHLQRGVTGTGVGDAMANMGAGLRDKLPGGLVDFIDNPQGYFDAQAAKGVRPGKVGEFVGNVAGTAWVPGAPLVQGAVGGALLSDKTDAGGVLKDAAIGGAAGRAGAFVSDLATTGVGKLLSKAPKVMDLPALEAAKKAAYKAVDDSGFIIPKASVSGMVDDFAKTVQSSALSKSAKDDAASIIQYARSLTKGDLTLSQLEKLRGDIYEAMVKKGGDTGRIGAQFRAKIDGVIDGVDNGLVRTARDLNARLKKADLVKRSSQSADIRAEKDYGGDYGRKVKDRVFPLIDPANPNRNLRGATPDEVAALTKVVTGTKAQNLASTVGGMLDPRRLGGKILSGITTTGGGAGAPLTGGLSLLVPALQMGAGFGLTGYASKTARNSVDDLIRLIAAGGSKQALKRAPTPASLATQEAMDRFARPLAVAVSAPSLAAARAKDRPKR